MKNYIFLFVLVLAMAAMPAYGQKFSVGVNAGLNVSTLSEPGNLYDNNALKTGFAGGLAFHYSFSDAFGIQSGIIYEQKGFKDRRDASTGLKLTGKYNYITVPLLAEGSLPLAGKTRLYGLTGLYAGFKTYTDNTLSYSGEDNAIPAADEDVNSFDGGWVFGGGVQVPTGNHSLQIGFKYSQGLSEVLASSPDDRNKSVLIGATLFF
jgi:hypothetical protein